MLPESVAGNPPRSIVTDHYLLDTSYGYIVKPVAMAIKTKHAGFNLVSC
jgi:hypothetical protein